MKISKLRKTHDPVSFEPFTVCELKFDWLKDFSGQENGLVEKVFNEELGEHIRNLIAEQIKYYESLVDEYILYPVSHKKDTDNVTLLREDMIPMKVALYPHIITATGIHKQMSTILTDFYVPLDKIEDTMNNIGAVMYKQLHKVKLQKCYNYFYSAAFKLQYDEVEGFIYRLLVRGSC